MKKTLLLLSVISIFGCSGSDDSDNVLSDVATLNPPEWIQGTWLLDGDDNHGFRFTTDDVCIISFSLSACNKAQLEQFAGTEIVTEVRERITALEYEVEITVGGHTTEYEFEKYQGGIMWANNSSHPVYIKQ